MYWVYENWRAKGHYAKVHRGTCGCCKNGRGLTTGTRADNGRWLGPFQTFEEALDVSAATEAQASVCLNCLRIQSKRRNNG